MRGALLCLLVACAAPKIPTSTDEVEAVRARFIAAFNGKQLEAIAQLYATDAIYLPVTGNRLVSRMAVHNLYAQIFEKFTPSLTLTTKYTERFGELAYETGEYTESVSSPEGSLNLVGSYIFVYRHDGKDGWHFASQAWTEQHPRSD
jgi:uncharacterized protein (TIGR02246 family)